MLDLAIHYFFDLPNEKKFYNLFKRRNLIVPATSQTQTPNAEVEYTGKGRKMSNARETYFGNQTSNTLELLMPKLFDDVSQKFCKDFAANLDTETVLLFINNAMASVEGKESIEFMFLFSAQ